LLNVKNALKIFASRWGKLVGNARLLYAHTPDGKRRLLQAKQHYPSRRSTNCERRLGAVELRAP
jgi:hypothetical protein